MFKGVFSVSLRLEPSFGFESVRVRENLRVEVYEHVADADDGLVPQCRGVHEHVNHIAEDDLHRQEYIAHLSEHPLSAQYGSWAKTLHVRDEGTPSIRPSVAGLAQLRPFIRPRVELTR